MGGEDKKKSKKASRSGKRSRSRERSPHRDSRGGAGSRDYHHRSSGADKPSSRRSKFDLGPAVSSRFSKGAPEAPKPSSALAALTSASLAQQASNPPVMPEAAPEEHYKKPQDPAAATSTS